MRHAFEEAGYSVEDDPGASLVARNGTETVFVSGRGEGTNVHLMYDVPHREFRDNEAGSGAARDYIAREAARVQPQANATVQRIAGALGLGGVAAPTVGGTYAIC